MIRRMPWGWRNIKRVPLEKNEIYFAHCDEYGRGIIGKREGTWFFIQGRRSSCVFLPVHLLKNIFCLYPLHKD